VDKKSLLGLGIIALLMGVWLYMNGPSDEQIARSKQFKDSIAQVEKVRIAEEAKKLALADTVKAQPVVAPVNDSAQLAAKQGRYRDFTPALMGKDTVYTIENDLLKVYIASKGGFVKQVELKAFNRYGQTAPLRLFSEDSTQFALALSVYNRSDMFYTNEFYFEPIQQSGNAVTMRLKTAHDGSYIDFKYSLSAGDYKVKSGFVFNGMEQILSTTEDQIQLSWSMLYPQQEQYIAKEKEAATIYYKQLINDPDYINPMKDEKLEINEDDIKWIAFKQQFFNSTIIAKQGFAKAGSFIRLSQRPDSKEVVKVVEAQLGIPYTVAKQHSFDFDFYFGPNHYNTLKQYDEALEQMIPTGWSIFSYINKWMVIPLFNALSSMNMGIVILILTIIVKVLLLPIAYKTYMSSARMRLLKPELDMITAKLGKNPDPMKKQQEQMNLYRKAGVSPLSGCVPVLLQFPILIALFNFVPAAIELRQKAFLWADDLSTYDSIWTFGEVPFINWAYGDHVSLFAAMMFVSTIIYTYMNSSMMPTQNEQMPGMKFMMYFMPVIFLAVMNKYSAGLSWYYFLANMFTFLQNFIIRRIVSDDKIRTQLEANMKAPVKVSAFQKRIEEMARQQQGNKKKK